MCFINWSLVINLDLFWEQVISYNKFYYIVPWNRKCCTIRTLTVVFITWPVEFISWSCRLSQRALQTILWFVQFSICIEITIYSFCVDIWWLFHSIITQFWKPVKFWKLYCSFQKPLMHKFLGHNKTVFTAVNSVNQSKIENHECPINWAIVVDQWN